MPTKRKINSRLTFDESTGRYRAPDGRFVSKQVVRRESQKVANAVSKHLVALTEKLRAGEISRSDWLIRFRDELKTGHSLNAILARGGRDSMTSADWGKVGQIARTQYDFLSRFALDIGAGKPIHLGRVRLYAGAVRLTYENTLTALALDHDSRQLGRWLRTINESCPGCVEQESLGVRPLAEIPGRGSQECLSNCHCFVQLVAA